MRKNKNGSQHQFLYLFVFIAGASTMALEMAASRLLAPNFGTSLIVWANLIGLIMLALSVGYYLGGRLADRRPDVSILYGIGAGAGLYFSIIPSITRLILQAVSRGIMSTPFYLTAGSFLATLLVFFLPVVLLGIISPFSIRILASNLDRTGNTSGNLYAVSTLGSLVGTFSSALFIIPTLGSRQTVYIFGFLLVTASALGLGKRRFLLLPLIPLAMAWLGPTGIKTEPATVYEKETPYQYVRILRNGEWLYLETNEGGGIQSSYHPTQLLTGWYSDYLLMLPYLRPGDRQKSVLVVGFAGGTIARQYYHLLRGAFKIDLEGVELDPEIARLARRYFGITGREGRVYVADGRIYLAQTRKRYDIIIVDAYSNQIYIPFHLATREFFALTEKHLRPGGILAINVNALEGRSPILQSIATTIRAVYPFTYIVSTGRSSLNYLVVASDSPVDPAILASKMKNPALEAVSRRFRSNFSSFTPVGLPPSALPAATAPAAIPGSPGNYPSFPSRTTLLLTDNRAPLEFLTDAMVLGELARTQGAPRTPARN